jgi:hypothetical protein
LHSAKGAIEAAIQAHFHEVEREAGALAQGALSPDQHARVEAIRASGAQVVAAVCGALGLGAPTG